MSDYRDIPVADLVPHSPPMVLIDKIIEYTDDTITAEINIVSGCPFYDEDVGGVPCWVGIEYMAQAVSALGGIRAKIKNEEVSIGFLLGTRKYSMPEKVFFNKQTYQVHAKELLKADAGLAVFECQILQGQQVWAEAKINVFVVNDASDAVNNTKQE